MTIKYLQFFLTGLAIIVAGNVTSTAAANINNSISRGNIGNISQINDIQGRTIIPNIAKRNVNIIPNDREAIAGTIRSNEINRISVAKSNISEISRIAGINPLIIDANIADNEIASAIIAITA